MTELLIRFNQEQTEINLFVVQVSFELHNMINTHVIISPSLYHVFIPSDCYDQSTLIQCCTSVCNPRKYVVVILHKQNQGRCRVVFEQVHSGLQTGSGPSESLAGGRVCRGVELSGDSSVFPPQ